MNHLWEKERVVMCRPVALWNQLSCPSPLTSDPCRQSARGILSGPSRSPGSHCALWRKSGGSLCLPAAHRRTPLIQESAYWKNNQHQKQRNRQR